MRLDVLRAYATRHGSGPFVIETAALIEVLPEAHNVPNAWHLALRFGHLTASWKGLQQILSPAEARGNGCDTDDKATWCGLHRRTVTACQC